MSGPKTWWRDDESIRRYVSDLVAGELARLRPGAHLAPQPWPKSMSLSAGELACDSLEVLNLATALAEALQMHRSGLEDYLLTRRTLGDWGQAATAALERFSAELSFRTSGSTGAPKTVSHALVDLIEEVESHVARLPGRRRVLSAVPAHHIYGFLFTVLLPLRTGVRVLDLRRSSPAGVSAILQEGDLIVGHPAFWGAFARGVNETPPDVVGVSSTAPCPAETVRLTRSRGLARFVEIYGSSETAGVGWREDPDAAFRLLPYWRRSREADLLVRVAQNGGVTEVRAQDRLAWSGVDEFRLEGRSDEAVQVGGVNVFPAAVRRDLLRHPRVRDAAVRLMNPAEGARLKAFIVPHDPAEGPAALRRDLETWCDANLAAPARPKAFSFGAALPLGALGKDGDWPAPRAESPEAIWAAEPRPGGTLS